MTTATAFNMTRTCRICGAWISDDNPDGIGSTCREVWGRARSATFAHFFGLDRWKRTSRFWVERYISTFAKTKFRSEFKKSFYASITGQDINDLRISRKQLDIIKSHLEWKDRNRFLDWCNEIDQSEKAHYFEAEFTPEMSEYQYNMAKKFYGEARP